MLNAAREQDEPETIGAGDAWFLGLSGDDDQLLTEERILDNELGFAAGEIGRGSKDERGASGLRQADKNRFQERDELAEEPEEHVK